MPHKVLKAYLNRVESTIQSIKDGYVEKYEEEFLAEDRVNLRIRLRFKNGFLFELNEAMVIVKGALSHLNYRYHFQNEKNELVFRYDNTPHFPNLEIFPHHQHKPDEVVSSSQPDVIRIINEAVNTARKNK